MTQSARQRLHRCKRLPVGLLGLAMLLLLPVGSPAQEQDQKVIRVPQDQATIRAAIEAAPVGADVETVIQVRPGTYMEDLTIDGKEDVTIRPAEAGDVIVMGSVSISTSVAIELRGLTIQGGSHGIDVQDASLTLRDTQVRSSRGPGLNLVDVLATLHGVTLAEHAGDGLTLTRTKARLEDTVIEDNQGLGASLSDQSSIGATKTTIRNNRGDGLQLTESSAELVDSLIRGNEGCGVRSGEGSSIRGRGNRVARNAEANLCPDTLPVELTTNIRRIPDDIPTVAGAIDAISRDPILHLSPGIYRINLAYQSESLELRGAGPDSVTLVAAEPRDPVVRIGNTSSVVLQGLSVRGAMGEGAVVIGDHAELELRQARISGHRNRSAAALLLQNNARAELRDVAIAGNRSMGLTLTDNAQADLQGAEVNRNGVHGLSLQGSAIAQLSGTELNANVGQGLRVKGSAQAFVSGESEIAENGDAGIDVQTLAGVSVLNSAIVGNARHGLWVQGFAELGQSTVQGNGSCGIKAETGAQIVGAGNTVGENGQGLCPDDYTWPPDFRKER